MKVMKARVCIVVRVLWQIGVGVFLINTAEFFGLSMLTHNCVQFNILDK